MNELNQILQQRRQKADELVELGTSLFCPLNFLAEVAKICVQD